MKEWFLNVSFLHSRHRGATNTKKNLGDKFSQKKIFDNFFSLFGGIFWEFLGHLTQLAQGQGGPGGKSCCIDNF
jgi:hypothetical protein